MPWNSVPGRKPWLNPKWSPPAAGRRRCGRPSCRRLSRAPASSRARPPRRPAPPNNLTTSKMKTYQAKTFFKLACSSLCVWVALSLVGTGRAQVVNNNPGTSAITFSTQQVETGPVLDVVPDVLSDGYTINLTLIPSLTEFVGYQTPPSIAGVTGGLNVVQLPVILPDFTVRQ